MGKAQKKDLAVVQENKTPATVHDYGQDSNAGFENTSASDMAIPFIAVLQAQSPVVIQGVDGARPGKFYNTVTKELSDTLLYLPCHIDHKIVQWTPVTKGGGFQGVHELDSPLYRDAIKANGGKVFGKLTMPNGDELVETYYVYGLVLDPDGETFSSFGSLAVTSTKIKKFRAWNTSMQMLKGRPPLFANRAKVTTFLDHNKAGQQFFNINIDPFSESWMSSLISPDSQLIQQAKSFREMVVSGQAKVDHAAQRAEGETAGEGGSQATPNGKVPF